MTTEQLAPSCGRCRRRHLVDLPCWAGRYAARVTAWVLAVQGTVCWLGYRGCTGVATTADHVTPRSEGGTDDPDNLRPACQPCNAARGRRTPFTPDPDPVPTGVGLSPRWRPTT